MDEKITFGILKCLTHFGQKPQEIEGICQHVTGSYHLEASRINPKGKIKGYSEQIIILPGNVDKLIKKQMEKNNRPTDKKTHPFQHIRASRLESYSARISEINPHLLYCTRVIEFTISEEPVD